MNADSDQPTAPSGRAFSVRYTSGAPPSADQPVSNTFGLHGEGRVLVDDQHLTFEGERSGFKLGGPPRLARADVANVDFEAASNALLIRTRNTTDYVIVWVNSREEAEALWALMPQQKSPEFLADQEHRDRFARSMKMLGRRAFVTPTIIAINVAVFIVMLAAGADLVRPNSALHIRFGSNFGPLTWTGQEWRLLTSAFLHFGIIHIALNMYALYQGGGLVERLFGSTRFALLYLLSALSGSVISGWWDPSRNSAGASGAIFGVFGALLAFMAIRRADIPASMLKSIGSSALLFCLYSLVIGAAHPLIDNAAHIGGLVAGIACGVILARPFTPEARAAPQPAKFLVAALAVGLPLIWLAQPLLASDGPRASELRFGRDLYLFGPIEGEIVRKQADILTFPPDVRVNRYEIAKRLRTEVLAPWRDASRPLLEADTLPQDDSQRTRLQAAIRQYLRARERAISLRALSFETGDASDEARALSAETELGKSLNEVNAIVNEGN